MKSIVERLRLVDDYDIRVLYTRGPGEDRDMDAYIDARKQLVSDVYQLLYTVCQLRGEDPPDDPCALLDHIEASCED